MKKSDLAQRRRCSTRTRLFSRTSLSPRLRMGRGRIVMLQALRNDIKEGLRPLWCKNVADGNCSFANIAAAMRAHRPGEILVEQGGRQRRCAKRPCGGYAISDDSETAHPPRHRPPPPQGREYGTEVHVPERIEEAKLSSGNLRSCQVDETRRRNLRHSLSSARSAGRRCPTWLRRSEASASPRREGG